LNYDIDECSNSTLNQCIHLQGVNFIGRRITAIRRRILNSNSASKPNIELKSCYWASGSAIRRTPYLGTPSFSFASLLFSVYLSTCPFIRISSSPSATTAVHPDAHRHRYIHTHIHNVATPPLRRHQNDSAFFTHTRNQHF